MIDFILNWLEQIGLGGLFAAMFLEGSSLPFPGIAIVLAYGSILPFSYWNTFIVAVGMSITYSMASLIPYIIGRKFEGILGKKSKKGLKKATDFFIRYGGWSVALTRPFGLGNYISYVAGISRMNMTPYLILTFIGIFPWSFIMILLGYHLNGSYEALLTLYHDNSIYFYIALAISSGIIFIYISQKIKKNQGKQAVLEGGNNGA
ncbi:VTT domain-containing protein [Cytobacillus suaedae]|nr:VTT domain-containing protein [Cytobacillus suaedae]